MRSKKAVPTQLYRHYDEDGYLLYVGISISAVARLCAHVSTASWATKIALISVEHFPSRLDAIMAETNAIINEHPRHNVMNAESEAKDLPILSEETVIEMRAMVRSGLSIKDVAAKFGAGRATTANAVRGKSWRNVPGAIPSDRRRTNLETVAEVKALLASGEPSGVIAKKVGLTAKMVSRISTGERHSKVVYGRPDIRKRLSYVPNLSTALT